MRSTKLMLLATVLFAFFAIAGTGTAFAACSDPFDCFAAADGDQASGPSGQTDWQDVVSEVAVATDPAKGVDTKFSGGDKENNPGGWQFITGNNTPKTDILEGWSRMKNNVLEVGFVRAKQNGNTFLSFELNQKGAVTKADGYAYPQRSTGDILFTYDVDTTNKLSFGICTWQGDSNSGVWRRLDGTPVGNSIHTCTKLSPSGPPPIAEGNVNWGQSIKGYLSGYDPIDAGKFGEAAVDFGAGNSVLAAFAQNTFKDSCGPNGWFWMHSRAAESVVSQPKDVLTGAPLTNPSCDFTIDKKVSATGDPGTFIDTTQAAALAATVGQEVTYSVTVTNTGDSPMTFDVTDPLCSASPLASGTVIAAGASSTFTCKYVVTGNEATNPFVNQACAHAAEMHSAGDKCDDAWVESFKPGELGGVSGTKFIDANGNGENDGDQPGAGFVFYVDYNGDSSLSAGEPAAASASDGTWTITGVKPGSYTVREVGDAKYTCTKPSPCQVDNVAVSGGATTPAGEFGNAPVAQIQAPDAVKPPDGQVVLGERITPGRARLLGPTGCTSRAFHARIRGTKVAKVVFTLDGHRIKTLTKKNFRGTFAVRINPRHLKIGVHRLIAKVTFQRGSGTKAKTYRLAFQRCPRALRAPRFTG